MKKNCLAKKKQPFLSLTIRLLLITATWIFGLSESVATDNEFRLGVLTTFKMECGLGTIKATELAVEEINAKGGILGKPVKIFVADDEGSPEKGIMALKRLIEKDKVHMVTGGAVSGVVLACLELLMPNNLIFMNTGASAPLIADKIDKSYDKYKYQFRIVINAANMAESIVNDSLKHLVSLGYKRFAILAEDSAWNRGLTTFLEKNLPKIGGTLATVITFDPKTMDFAPIFSKVTASKADVAIPLLAHTDTITLYKQWYEVKAPFRMAGFNNPGLDPMYWQKTGGACLSEVNVGWGVLVRNKISAKSVPFFDNYSKKYGVSPNLCSSTSYDAVWVLAEAATKAKTLETNALIKALEDIDYTGAAGRIVFDKKTHDAKYSPDYMPFLVTQWQEGGKWVILSPIKFASGEFINPPWLK